jgi:hypothetical protein
MIKFLHNFALFWVINAIFLAKKIGENIFIPIYIGIYMYYRIVFTITNSCMFEATIKLHTPKERVLKT